MQSGRKKKDIDAAWNRMNKLQSTRELFRLMLIGKKILNEIMK